MMVWRFGFPRIVASHARKGVRGRFGGNFVDKGEESIVDELPKGWAEAEIGSLCSLENGRAFKPTDWTTTGFPIVRIQNLNNPKASFNHFNQEVDERYFLRGGELLFAWSGTPGTSFGAHVWKGGEAVLNQHIFRVDLNSDLVDKRFFRFAINQKLNELIGIAHGGVGLRHVTKGKFEKTEVSLPPLNEQKRIADRLTLLLTRIDKTKAHLDRIPPLLKRFRQSVLAAATSGHLTKDWREANGPDNGVLTNHAVEPDGEFLTMIRAINYRLPDDWTWVIPDSIKAPEKYSLSIGPFGSNLVVRDYKDSGIPLVFVREIRAQQFGDEKTKYVNAEKAAELWAHRVEPGDILITKMGDPPGDVAILPQGRPISIITSDCIRLKVDSKIVNTKLLAFFVESNIVRSRERCKIVRSTRGQISG
jgi:type I restriction enzyme, S subunit